ncbi:MFS transporter [Ramlibacter sp.]|uniref:MFS transporter n=1 Tax=Ramlibacter sp. TaxID=1917967 RepID=UPI003D104786
MPSLAPSRVVMLGALMSAFALSQAFRTIAAILAPPLAREFGLSPAALGIYAGAFHFSFALLQFVMGIAIDMHGVRRTVLVAFPSAMAGALVCANAGGFGTLVVGQALIGIGCAPAFLVCTVFIARRFEPERFASVSGLALGIGSVGLLLTGTPLAWLVERTSWRAGYLALAACAAFAWLAIFVLVRESGEHAGGKRMRLREALGGYGVLFRLPHTAGILLLGLFTYAAFLSLRGLWLGPLLIDRHEFTLVQTGNVALFVSVVGMAGPPLFGRLDPGPKRRRVWITGFTVACAVVFATMAFSTSAWLDVALGLAVGVLSGFIVLQYADVRNAYPAEMTGRAMAVFTMSMFLGVALMQWLTGAIATAALAAGVEAYFAVLIAIAGFLAVAAAACRLLPAPQGTIER